MSINSNVLKKIAFHNRTMLQQPETLALNTCLHFLTINYRFLQIGFYSNMLIFV
jgi:hypothetical protein